MAHGEAEVSGPACLPVGTVKGSNTPTEPPLGWASERTTSFEPHNRLQRGIVMAAHLTEEKLRTRDWEESIQLKEMRTAEQGEFAGLGQAHAKLNTG